MKRLKSFLLLLTLIATNFSFLMLKDESECGHISDKVKKLTESTQVLEFLCLVENYVNYYYLIGLESYAEESKGVYIYVSYESYAKSSKILAFPLSKFILPENKNEVLEILSNSLKYLDDIIKETKTTVMYHNLGLKMQKPYYSIQAQEPVLPEYINNTSSFKPIPVLPKPKPDVPIRPVEPIIPKPVHPIIPEEPIIPKPKPDIPVTPIDIKPKPKPDIPIRPVEPVNPKPKPKPDVPIRPVEPITPIDSNKPALNQIIKLRNSNLDLYFPYYHISLKYLFPHDIKYLLMRYKKLNKVKFSPLKLQTSLIDTMTEKVASYKSNNQTLYKTYSNILEKNKAKLIDIIIDIEKYIDEMGIAAVEKEYL